MTNLVCYTKNNQSTRHSGTRRRHSGKGESIADRTGGIVPRYALRCLFHSTVLSRFLRISRRCILCSSVSDSLLKRSLSHIDSSLLSRCSSVSDCLLKRSLSRIACSLLSRCSSVSDYLLKRSLSRIACSLLSRYSMLSDCRLSRIA